MTSVYKYVVVTLDLALAILMWVNFHRLLPYTHRTVQLNFRLYLNDTRGKAPFEVKL